MATSRGQSVKPSERLEQDVLLFRQKMICNVLLYVHYISAISNIEYMGCFFMPFAHFKCYLKHPSYFVLLYSPCFFRSFISKTSKRHRNGPQGQLSEKIHPPGSKVKGCNLSSSLPGGWELAEAAAKISDTSALGLSLNGGTPISHPQVMIIFSSKTHGCWGNPPF